MPYRMYVTRELQIFTYENEPLQIKYECPQKPSYYQAKGPSAYIWPTNSPNQIEWWINLNSHIYYHTHWWTSLPENIWVDVHKLTRIN